MAYLTNEELKEMGFKRLGKGVKVSTKASIYNPECIELGDFSRVDDFCVISGNVTLGRYVHIAPFCLVAGGEKGVVMEDFSGLAYGVYVFSQSDDYSGCTLTNSTVSAKFKNEYKAKVKLGKHVIVGARSVVLPGVELAEGCAVGAMSLVNNSTDPWGVYLGNPARRLRDRKKDLLKLEHEFLKEQKNDSL
jgi:acetyltransferase-like isoleucine patch superfamily enzyme